MTDKEKAIDFLECRRGYYASLSTDPNPYVKATKVCGYTLAESANACLMAIEALEKEPCDAISRKAAIDAMIKIEKDDIEQYGCAIPEGFNSDPAVEALNNLPPVTPQYTDAEIQKMQEMEQAEIEKAYELGKAEQPEIGHCKDCKHWKDSDGTYRRDINAESKCPMNRKEVYEGTGYCFLFESKTESKTEE